MKAEINAEFREYADGRVGATISGEVLNAENEQVYCVVYDGCGKYRFDDMNCIAESGKCDAETEKNLIAEMRNVFSERKTQTVEIELN